MPYCEVDICSELLLNPNNVQFGLQHNTNMASLSVYYQPPALELRPLITTYYWATVPSPIGEVRDWLYPEWPNIRFLLEGTWAATLKGREQVTPPRVLFGPTSCGVPVVGSTPSRIVGVGLMPLGFAAFFDIDAAGFTDQFTSLDNLLPGAEALYAGLAADPDQDAQARRLDDYFIAYSRSRAPPSLSHVRLHAALLDPELRTVDELAAAFDVSPRHLARMCQRLFGFAPKLLIRRVRFMRTLEAILASTGRRHTEVLDAAYYDQSHFVRDFHFFMGLSPSQYFALERPFMSVAAQARLRSLGASFQGLQGERLGLSRPAEAVL
jgi:AraC-like DNA-binding protein